MSEEIDCLFIELLKRYLKEYWSEDKPWKLGKTVNYGRGIIAARDIQANEVIFCDLPLLIGPIGSPNESLICVACYKTLDSIEMCSEKCGLPVCSDCPNKEQHRFECDLYRKWQPKQVEESSFMKIKYLTAVRSLNLTEDAKKLFKLLQKNNSNDKSINFFIDEFTNFPKNGNLPENLTEAMTILNTNAFKTPTSSGNGISIYLKGLYALTSLMNHTCTPNTRHNVNDDFVKTVSAARNITKGEQIFTTYSQLLWGTNTRRMHLALTKQFFCVCDRCADPTENDSFLSAYRCLQKPCDGLLVSQDSLNLSAAWQCNRCCDIVHGQKIIRMHDVFGSMVKNFFNGQHSADETLELINKKLCNALPSSHQFVLDAQWKAIEQLGELRRRENITLDQLKAAEAFCLNILDILEKLKVGFCLTKGSLCYELYKSRQKIVELNGTVATELPALNDFRIGSQSFDDYLMQTTSLILKNIVAATADL